VGGDPVKYLLDTHVWIWAMESLEKIPRDVLRVLHNPDNLPFGLSAITPWEAVKKEALGRLRLSSPMRAWLSKAVREPFISLLPLTVDIAYESNHLPAGFHRDPADQMIVATARIHDLTLITCDDSILAYPHVKTLWGSR
jgi:PIN domain nuclease of toxin-antitoxin system